MKDIAPYVRTYFWVTIWYRYHDTRDGPDTSILAGQELEYPVSGYPLQCYAVQTVILPDYKKSGHIV